MSITHFEVEKSKYSLLSNVSEEDMARARKIAGEGNVIHAVLKPHPNASKCWYIWCNRNDVVPPAVCCCIVCQMG